MVLKLNGTRFAQVLRAGTLAVVREQETLDRINVFPVPDADTGANLAATFKAATARLGDDSPEALGDAARAAADAALLGARGNSGAIVAQFLHGLAQSFGDSRNAGTREFAQAADSGAQAAYRALQEPREGTILSVLRAWAHELREHSADHEDFAEVLRHALKGAHEALALTPRQLDVLARNHVVDAGGQGFVYFLEGILESFRGDGHAHDWQPIEAPPRGVPPFGAAHAEMDSTYRFCTEALLSRADEATSKPGPIDREALAAAVTGFGSSLVVAGGGDRLRVHIHTNEPRGFLETVAAYGVIDATKIDDMVLQQLSLRRSAVALVTDSTCELPEEQAGRLGLVTVPLTISFGEESYLDGVDMTLDGFVRRLRATSAVPKSSQPAVADLRDTYRHLLEYREGIVSIHITSAMSGTCQAAVTAAHTVDTQRIKVIDSRTVSVGAGLLIEAVGETLAAGASLDEAAEAAVRVRDDITVFGAVPDLEFAVRGGRVNARAARAIDLLRLKPIITFDRLGAAQKGGVALGWRRALAAIVRRAGRYAAGAPARYMIVHTGDAEGAGYAASLLKDRYGAVDVPIVRSGPVLTTNVGLGSVSIAVRRRAET